MTEAVNPDPAETVSETVPEKLPMLEAVMVVVPEEPASMLIVEVLEAIPKSADWDTVRVRDAECERLPLDPVTRTV